MINNLLLNEKLKKLSSYSGTISGTTCKGSVARLVSVSVAWGISTSSPSSDESSISGVVNVGTK